MQLADETFGNHPQSVNSQLSVLLVPTRKLTEFCELALERNVWTDYRPCLLVVLNAIVEKLPSTVGLADAIRDELKMREHE
jgi:hypothetical protein